MLTEKIQSAVHDAQRARDAKRLETLRFIMAAIRRKEVDDRVTLTNEQVLDILQKMVQQQRDAISHFSPAGRNDLVEKAMAEIAIIQEFLPPPLSHAEIKQLVQEAIRETNAQTMRDMGKVMNWLKPKLQGRAEMSQITEEVKTFLTS